MRDSNLTLRRLRRLRPSRERALAGPGKAVADFGWCKTRAHQAVGFAGAGLEPKETNNKKQKGERGDIMVAARGGTAVMMMMMVEEVETKAAKSKNKREACIARNRKATQADGNGGLSGTAIAVPSDIEPCGRRRSLPGGQRTDGLLAPHVKV